VLSTGERSASTNERRPGQISIGTRKV
jgi:hypothetical protein